MVNPDKNNKRIFRVILVVAVAVMGFAGWLMYTASARLR
jgi:hypothetical protein